MNPTPFNNKKTRWRVQLPARFDPVNHRRITKYFPNKEAAEKFCVDVRKNGFKALEITAPVLSQTEETAFSLAVRHELAELGNNPALLHQAVAHFKANVLNVKPATVREAVETFYAHRLELLATGRLKKTTLNGDRERISKFIDRFERMKLVGISAADLNEFIESHGHNGPNVFKSLSVFYSWARKNNYLKENPIRELKASDYGDFGVNNEYYPVNTFRRMLRISAGLEPVKPGGELTRDFADLLPYFVLSGFAGLRRCEVVRREHGRDSIKWADLYFDAEIPNIEVRETVAKSTRRKTGDKRHIDFPHAVEAVRAWLALVPKNDDADFMVKWTQSKINKLRREFRKRTGIKLLENGLRNSFATYAFSYSGESALGQVSRQMGNSETVVRRHYAKNLPAGTGKAWFDLRPFEVVQASARTRKVASV